jgi:methylmalonyl-CoA mutase
MLRTTVEAFAGAVGGVNSMHTGPFDETIGQPDEFSRRIARNTQIILQHESQLTKVLDPAGGSWYVEKLTDDVARGTWALLRQVEEQGGMLAALQNGFPQTQVSETAAQRSKNLSTRKDILVGTNKYANLLESLPEANNPDLGELHRVRAKFIARYRTGNDNTHSTEVMSKLAQLRDASAETVLTAAIDAALAGATLGEITRTLSGDSQSATVVTPLPTLRASEKFEAMRAFAEVYLTKHGARPKVFLANYGPLPKHKPRADFSTDFFSVGGFEVISNAGFSTPEAAAQAALESGAPVVVICGTDDVYPEIVPPLTQAIKSAKPAVTVILAGYPAEQIEAHKAAGVDDFIHIRANVVEVLSKLQQAL